MGVGEATGWDFSRWKEISKFLASGTPPHPPSRVNPDQVDGNSPQLGGWEFAFLRGFLLGDGNLKSDSDHSNLF